MTELIVEARRRGDRAPRSRAPGSRRGRPPLSTSPSSCSIAARTGPSFGTSGRAALASSSTGRASRSSSISSSSFARAPRASFQWKPAATAFWQVRAARWRAGSPRGTPASALVSASPASSRSARLISSQERTTPAASSVSAPANVRVPPHELVGREPGGDADVEGPLVLRDAAEERERRHRRRLRCARRPERRSLPRPARALPRRRRRDAGSVCSASTGIRRVRGARP